MGRQAAFSFAMSKTDAEVLESLKLTRDRVLTALESGDPVVEWEVGGVRKRKKPTVEWIKELEALIAHYETKCNTDRRAAVVRPQGPY